MPVTFAVRGPMALPAAPTAYVGPGESPGPTAIGTGYDVWRAFWGMRALTQAIGAAGTAAIRIRDSTTTTENDIHLTSTGGLNVSEISAALPGGHSGTITTFYDQTGQLNHLTQTTASLQPIFVPSIALVGNRPGASFAGAQCLYNSSLTGSASFDVRFSFLGVFMCSGSGGGATRNMFIQGTGGNSILQANNSSVADIWGVTSGGSTVTAAVNGVYHTGIGDFRQTTSTSTLYVDGSAGTAVDIGSPYNSVGGVTILGSDGIAAAGTQNLNGVVCEGGMYNGDITSYISALDSNMSAWYSI